MNSFPDDDMVVSIICAPLKKNLFNNHGSLKVQAVQCLQHPIKVLLFMICIIVRKMKIATSSIWRSAPQLASRSVRLVLLTRWRCRMAAGQLPAATHHTRKTYHSCQQGVVKKSSCVSLSWFNVLTKHIMVQLTKCTLCFTLKLTLNPIPNYISANASNLHRLRIYLLFKQLLNVCIMSNNCEYCDASF